MFDSILRWKDLFLHLVKTDIKLSYNNRVLGYFWTLFDPIVMSAIYLGLVVYVFGRGYPGFAAVLFLSLLVWKWVTSSVNQSILALPSKSKLLLTVRFPKIILPLTAVSIPFVKLLFGLIWVLPLMVSQSVYPSIGILWVFPVLGVVYSLCFGLSLFLSIFGVYFRDLANISTLFLRSGFYLSPILYNIEDTVPERYLVIYMLNPFASIFDSLMKAIRFGQSPSAWLLWPVALSLILMILGVTFFNRRSTNITKDL